MDGRTEWSRNRAQSRSPSPKHAARPILRCLDGSGHRRERYSVRQDLGSEQLGSAVGASIRTSGRIRIPPRSAANRVLLDLPDGFDERTTKAEADRLLALLTADEEIAIPVLLHREGTSSWPIPTARRCPRARNAHRTRDVLERPTVLQPQTTPPSSRPPLHLSTRSDRRGPCGWEQPPGLTRCCHSGWHGD